MAQRAVVSAVYQRLADLWANCPVIRTNEGALPPSDGSPFLVVQYPIANEDQITVGTPGSNVFRETGAIRFVLTINSASGLDWALDWIDQLRVTFRAKKFSGVNTWAPSSPTIDDGNVTSGYLLLSFAVPYYFDFQA